MTGQHSIVATLQHPLETWDFVSAAMRDAEEDKLPACPLGLEGQLPLELNSPFPLSFLKPELQPKLNHAGAASCFVNLAVIAVT